MAFIVSLLVIIILTRMMFLLSSLFSSMNRWHTLFVHCHCFKAAHDLTTLFIFLFALSWVNYPPGTLAILHGLCMTGWVYWTHSALTQSWLECFFGALHTASSTLNMFSLFVSFMYRCVCVFFFCFMLLSGLFCLHLFWTPFSHLLLPFVPLSFVLPTFD